MQSCGGLGIYQHLVDFAGAGATVPLTGFGNLLAKGAVQKVKEIGLSMQKNSYGKYLIALSEKELDKEPTRILLEKE